MTTGKNIALTIRNFQRRQWHPTPVLLPGKSHGPRSLVDRSPWGCEESDTTEQLHFHFSFFTFMHWRRKWQPTPVFVPGESQGWQSLVGCCLWGRTESDMTEWLSLRTEPMSSALACRFFITELPGMPSFYYINIPYFFSVLNIVLLHTWQNVKDIEKIVNLKAQIKENNRMGKIRDVFKKMEIPREYFMQR